MSAEKRPKKYFADQFDDEDVLFIFRKHPVVMRKGLIFSSIAIVLGPLYVAILTIIYKNDPSNPNYPSLSFLLLSLLAGMVLGAILFIPSWIAWHFSVFIVTDQRLIQITQKGLFHRSVVDIGLSQIQMVNYEIAGLQETMLGFGTIMMQTYMGDLVIHDVHHPAKIQKKLLNILRDEGIMTTNYPGPNDNRKSNEAENQEDN